MNFDAQIRAAEADPQALEHLYQNAIDQDWAERFRAGLLSAYEAAPDNLLYAAWFFRLQQADQVKPAARRGNNWFVAIPISIVTGLILWALSDVENLVAFQEVPQILLWWCPVVTIGLLAFQVLSSKKGAVRAGALSLGLLAAPAFVLLIGPTLSPEWRLEQYVVLAVIHLPLLCWIALGIAVLGINSTAEDRFAFLIKSIEVMITMGLYLIFGVAFGAITVGMFAALSIDLPEILLRLIVAGGFGLLPVLAVATVYEPTLAPSEQDFDQGLSRFIGTMMRLLLPLTLGVLLIYVLVIPFNFLEPYRNRDLLIVYNLMLFGILGLILGATPIRSADLSPLVDRWLHPVIIAVAILAELVSIYAISATLYRTFDGGLTLNRVTVIVWNLINIGILLWLLLRQARHDRPHWSESLRSVFSQATNAYVVWGLLLVVALPLLF